MSNKTEDFDHAFEFILIIINVTSTIMAQYAGSAQVEIVLPIIANIRRLSISIIFPTILTIFVWTISYFTNDETWKMFLKSYSWGYAVSLTLFEVTILISISLGAYISSWVAIPFLFFILLWLVFPLIPWLILRRILKCYKSRLKEIFFFTDKGKIGKLRRFIPFFISWLTFWFIFYLATIV